MAQSIQNVTVSFTLPISCQICLGKVRQPVICGNYHVFCSVCIEVWLKKVNQCPTCRTPITPENPCREIIGATNEHESNDTYSMKKKLRKTRSVLLLREYEDEIDGLQKENEELRSKNLTLEEQLKTALGSSSFQVSDKSEDVNQSSEGRRIDPHFLEEWARKLAAATELQEKLQVEIEKLKEANKTLRGQNVDLVRENSYLKAEVASRSPQKFGRYTVAALEAKISQYNRDVKHLQKALERSDKYIEELEAQVSQSQMASDKTAAVKNSGYVLQEMMNEHQAEEGVAGQGHCTMTGHTKTVTMKDSLSDVESSSVSIKRASADSSGPCDFFLTSKTLMTGIFCDKNSLEQNFTPEKAEHVSSMEHSIPSTPSSPFSCLSLKSPNICNDQKARRKPLSYLRKLSFDGCSGGLSATAVKSSVTPSCASGISTDHKSALKSSRPVCWEACTQKSPRSSCLTEPDKHLKDREKDQSQRTSSDASTDATYLDKVYELDSVISQGESSKSLHYPFSLIQHPDFDISFVPQLDTTMKFMTHSGSSLLEREKAHVVSSSKLCIKGTHNPQNVSIAENTQLTQNALEVSSVRGEDTMVTGARTGHVLQTDKTPDLPFCPHGLHGMEAESTLLSSPSDFNFAQAETLNQNCAESENATGSKTKAKSTKRQTLCCTDNSASPSKISKAP